MPRIPKATPLHYAAARGNAPAAAALAHAGADVHARDERDSTALHWACAGGKVDVAQGRPVVEDSKDPEAKNSKPCNMDSTSYTLYPESYTLYPIPYTLYPIQYIIYPTPYTLHPCPSPDTLLPTPYTLNPVYYVL